MEFKNKKSASGEDGSVLIIALLIMVLLTVVGLSVTATTDTDIQIAKNDQFHKTAFFNADSGLYASPKLISLCIANYAPQDISGFGISYTDTTSKEQFYNQIMGYENPDTAFDLEFSLGGLPVSVDIERQHAQNLSGGGVEFMSAYEGTGFSSAGGGVAIPFKLKSVGIGPKGSQSTLEANYIKVLGTGAEGGL